MRILEIGKIYQNSEPTISLELNLEDLYWMQSLVPHRDTFRKDLQEGIDAIECRNKILATKPDCPENEKALSYMR
ncbi:unnamed protein product [marine sediment metagenome]|uniref:Uncharacterized protein n=1 Tax=marine sediment metagenome TaxID=412755 RepID=X0Z0E4_9ZZZZ